MPVSINMPGRPEQPDPLEKLASIASLVKTVYGIHADSKTLDSALAKKAESDKLLGLQLKDAERKEAEAVGDEATTGPLIESIRNQAKARGLVIPEGVSVKQARTNFDAFLKPKEAKVVDPMAEEIKQMRLDEMKKKAADGSKRDKEFGGRFKNINTQLDALDKLIEEKGTYEMTGSHNKKLQQAIDSVAIDSAKLFDPESVARESEVAAFKNMLFEPGTLTTKNSTARDLLTNYKNIIKSRAENEGLAKLIPQEGAGAGDGVPPDVAAQAAAILEKRRKEARK